MRILARAGLVLSAFTPMVLVLALVRVGDFGLISLWIVLGSLVIGAILPLAIRATSGVQPRTMPCKTVRRADERILAFTSGLIAPAAIAAFGGGSSAISIAATAGIIALMLVIYVRANLYHLNPVLILMGYRVYEITLTNGAVVMLISRRAHIAQTETVEVHYLGEEVAVQRGR